MLWWNIIWAFSWIIIIVCWRPCIFTAHSNFVVWVWCDLYPNDTQRRTKFRCLLQIIDCIPNRDKVVEKDDMARILYMAQFRWNGKWYFANQFNLSSHVCTFNPLRARFVRGGKNIYLHFMSFLRIDMPQVVEIITQVRQGPTYST